MPARRRPKNLRDFLDKQLSKTALTEAGDFLALGMVSDGPVAKTALIQKLAGCGFDITEERIDKLAEEGRLILEPTSGDRARTWVRAPRP